MVRPRLEDVVVLTAERRFGSLLAEDPELLRRELRSPLGFGFLDLCHRKNSLAKGPSVTRGKGPGEGAGPSSWEAKRSVPTPCPFPRLGGRSWEDPQGPGIPIRRGTTGRSPWEPSR